MCFNKKVIAGLAVVGLGIYVFAPNLFAAALPVLLLAVCPLSMLLMGMMGKSMMGGQGTAQSEPAVRRAAAGVASAAGGARADRGEQRALLRAQLRQVGEQQTDLVRQLEQLEAAEPKSGAGEDGAEARHAVPVAARA